MCEVMICAEQNSTFVSYPLFQLAEDIIKSFSAKTGFNRSFIVNEIPAGITINADRELVATVISGLLSSAIAHAKNGTVLITAHPESERINIQVHLHNQLNPQSLGNLQPLAGKLGGFIGVSSLWKKVDTISFSLPQTKQVVS